MKDVFTVKEIGSLVLVSSTLPQLKPFFKRTVVLQGWGDKMNDEFVCTALDRTAKMNLHPGDIIEAQINCHPFEYGGFVYQRNQLIGFKPLMLVAKRMAN